MHRGIVKLDALPDADRARAENDDDRLAGALRGARLARAARHRIEIRRFGVELGGAGVHRLVGIGRVRQIFCSGEAGKCRVGVAERLAARVERVVRDAGRNGCFKVRQLLQFGKEETVDAGDLVDFVHGHACLQRLENREDAAVVDLAQAVGKRHIGERLCVQRIKPDLRAAHRLEECSLKGWRDRHDLTGRLHLRAELAGRARELVKRPLRELDDHIVERGLKAGAGLARDVVADLVKREPERDLGGDLGDRIAGCLGGERRGT